MLGSSKAITSVFCPRSRLAQFFDKYLFVCLGNRHHQLTNSRATGTVFQAVLTARCQVITIALHSARRVALKLANFRRLQPCFGKLSLISQVRKIFLYTSKLIITFEFPATFLILKTADFSDLAVTQIENEMRIIQIKCK